MQYIYFCFILDTNDTDPTLIIMLLTLNQGERVGKNILVFLFLGMKVIIDCFYALSYDHGVCDTCIGHLVTILISFCSQANFLKYWSALNNCLRYHNFFFFAWSQLIRQVPDIASSIERENHTHSFCCSEEGSLWVAQHVSGLIKNRMTFGSP